MALLAATEIGRQCGFYGFVYADEPLFAHVSTWLRTNLLKHILQRPGAATLPDSSGEAVSRFRDDVFEIPLFAIWINDILTGVVLMLIALGVMADINFPITLLALALFLLVGSFPAGPRAASSSTAAPAARPRAKSTASSAKFSARCRPSRPPQRKRT